MESLIRHLHGAPVLFLVSVLVACPPTAKQTSIVQQHPSPAALGNEPFDVYAVDLIVLSHRLADAATFDVLDRPRDCMMLAERAHAEALSIEAMGSPERLTSAQRQRLFRLHALAAELVETATAQPPLGFYGNVDGLTVSLHDLRDAQLAALAPELLEDLNPAVALRRATVRFYLEQIQTREALSDSAQVLALLRTPLDSTIPAR